MMLQKILSQIQDFSLHFDGSSGILFVTETGSFLSVSEGNKY